MSRRSKSGGGMWFASVFVALGLYVATWPLIEIKSMVSYSTTTSTGTSLEMITVSYSPMWTHVIYSPLGALQNSNGGDNLLQRYWAWWFNILS